MDKEYVMQVANTAREQLLAITPMNVILSWGIEKFIATVYQDMPALKFKVNGRLFKGFVTIALSGSDYYEIYLTDESGTKCISDEVCFDEMGSLLDRTIECGEDKAEYNKFCEAQLKNVFL